MLNKYDFKKMFQFVNLIVILFIDEFLKHKKVFFFQ